MKNQNNPYIFTDNKQEYITNEQTLEMFANMRNMRNHNVIILIITLTKEKRMWGLGWSREGKFLYYNDFQKE